MMKHPARYRIWIVAAALAIVPSPLRLGAETPEPAEETPASEAAPAPPPEECRMEGQTDAPSARFAKMRWSAALARLQPLVGEWIEDVEAHGPEGTARFENRVSIRWLPGCVWLEHSMEIPSAAPIGPMFGSWRVAWDDKAEEYVRHYVDNQSSKVLTTRGGWVDEERLEFTGSMDWYGTTYHFRESIRLLGDGGYRTWGSMARDGEEMKPNHEGRGRRLGSAAPAGTGVATEPAVEAAPASEN